MLFFKTKRRHDMSVIRELYTPISEDKKEVHFSWKGVGKIS